LLKEHSVDLLLQGHNHGKELLLSGLVEGWAPKDVPPIAVVIGKTYAMVMAIAMIPCRRMNNLLHLYLWLTID